MIQAKTKKKIGLVVNPYAGLGGRVGLKGSDGTSIVKKALVLGAVPEAPSRAQVALNELTTLSDKFEILTYSGPMGEDEVIASGMKPIIIGKPKNNISNAADTEKAVRELTTCGIDLLLFAGGDGTARNVLNALDKDIPVIGIPAGVKMHSAVYAKSPYSAGRLAALYLLNRTTEFRELEVMDIDEEAFRNGRVSAKLYGYLKVPHTPNLLQGIKTSLVSGEKSALLGIAQDLVERMEEDWIYVIGPGTTTRPLLELLKLPNTLLGVDVIMNKNLVAKDVNEKALLELVSLHPAKIIVTPIGGQGFIFGRGNQQISYRVIKHVGKNNIIVISTIQKLASLEGKPLLVDTGSEQIDIMLTGFMRILTGYKEEVVYRVNI